MKRLIDLRRIRRHLLAGLVVIAPVTATIWVLWWIFQRLDGLLGRFVYPLLDQYVPVVSLIPGLGLIALILVLVIVGWTAEKAIGSRIIAFWHNLLERFPLTRRIYGATHSIVRTVFGQEKRPFNTVVMIEYPSPGRWSIGFLAADAPAALQANAPGTVSVFVPTTPNPTTGYLVVIPREKVIPVEMTIEQAFTFILSAGAATPEDRLGGVAEPEAAERLPADRTPPTIPLPDPTRT